MPPTQITSPGNPRIKALVALRRRRQRDQHSEWLVEGYDELTLAVRAGARPRTVYVCPDLYAGDADLVTRCEALGAEIVQVSRPAFEKAAYRQGPDGILAVVPAPQRQLSDVDLPADPIVILAHGVEKPGNLGAMLRTADAVGVAAVISADPVTDWANPNVIRASKGAVFAVPVASASLEQALTWLAEQQIPLVAATPHASARYDAVDYRGPVAFALGAEHSGLPQSVLRQADHQVAIPMRGLADSLNVATTMAVLAFEARRQRDQAGAHADAPTGAPGRGG